MNAPLSAHSPFGGSGAARILRCPASVGLTEKVPDYLRRTSAYAERGTALHMAMALLLDDDPPSLESLAGKTFKGYAITSDDVEIALRPAYAYAAALIDTPELSITSNSVLPFQPSPAPSVPPTSSPASATRST